MDEEEYEVDSQSEEESEVSSRCRRVSDTVKVEVDFSDAFITRNIFGSREELLAWAHSVGRQNGIALIVKTSSNGIYGSRRPFVTLVCERGGNNRKRKLEEVGARKCGCPFKLKGNELGTGDELIGWQLTVVSGIHNHADFGNTESPNSADEMISVDDESKVLKRGVACQKLNVEEKVGKSQMQLLMEKLAEHKYVKWHRSCEITDEVTDMMWTHPASIALARNFPHVLIMDCTVKINRFRRPLLEIVGVTSTNLKFSVAFAYLKIEKAENYEWALRNLLKFMKGYPMPNVIVTDLEPELMKAVAVVYPDSRNLLCKWHIIRDIRINCNEMFVRRPLEWECFEWMWSCFVEEVTEESFDRKVSRLKENYPGALSYISQKWLDPFKDYFLTTNTCMHYGILVEPEFDKRFKTYYHSNLKLHLDSLKGSFADNWKNINGLLVQQYYIIASSFRTSKNIVQAQHGFKPAIFNELRGFVSEFALKKIRSELKRARDCLTVPFEMPCECNLQATYGLPCAHKLYEFQKNGIPIPLDLVDSHWKNLSMQPPKRRLVKKDNLDCAEDSKNLCMETKPRLVEENNLDRAENSKNLSMDPKPRLVKEDNLDCAKDSKNLCMETKPCLVEEDNLDRAEDWKNFSMENKPRLVEENNLDRAENSKNLSMETKPRLVEKDNLDRAEDWKNFSMETKPRLVEENNLDRAENLKNLSMDRKPRLVEKDILDCGEDSKNSNMEPKPRLVKEEILDCAEDLAKFSEFFNEQDAQTRRRLLKALRKIYKPDHITSSGE